MVCPPAGANSSLYALHGVLADLFFAHRFVRSQILLWIGFIMTALEAIFAVWTATEIYRRYSKFLAESIPEIARKATTCMALLCMVERCPTRESTNVVLEQCNTAKDELLVEIDVFVSQDAVKAVVDAQSNRDAVKTYCSALCLTLIPLLVV